MKRAHQYREYRNVHEFQAPDGIVTVEVDPETGQLATPACPSPVAEVFLSGTQPVESCQLHGGAGGTRVASWETAPPPSPAAAGRGAPAGLVVKPPPGSRARVAPPPPAQPSAPAQQQQAKKPEQKKGLLRRILGAFGK